MMRMAILDIHDSGPEARFFFRLAVVVPVDGSARLGLVYGTYSGLAALSLARSTAAFSVQYLLSEADMVPHALSTCPTVRGKPCPLAVWLPHSAPMLQWCIKQFRFERRLATVFFAAARPCLPATSSAFSSGSEGIPAPEATMAWPSTAVNSVYSLGMVVAMSMLDESGRGRRRAVGVYQAHRVVWSILILVGAVINPDGSRVARHSCACAPMRPAVRRGVSRRRARREPGGGQRRQP